MMFRIGKDHYYNFQFWILYITFVRIFIVATIAAVALDPSNITMENNNRVNLFLLIFMPWVFNPLYRQMKCLYLTIRDANRSEVAVRNSKQVQK